MRSSILLALGALASCASAINLVKKDEPKHVSLPFTRQLKADHPLYKRNGDLSVDVDKRNEGFLYWVNYTIGTPPVDLYAIVDTGSNDLLILTNNIQECVNNASDCHGGVVNSKDSSTWKWTQEQVSGSYGSGEGFVGNYATDTFGVGDATIKDFVFVGVTEYKATGNGIISIFGIGLMAGEDDVGAGGSGYNNLVYAMKKAGYINAAAYSMYLEDYDKGNFLFGAVDKSKYKDPLVTFSIPPDNQVQAVDRLTVVMTGLGTTKGGKSQTMNMTPRPALLDSGTEKTAFTLDQFEYIVATLGGAWEDDAGSFVAPCDGGGKDNTVDFYFSELTIKIPFSEFMVPTNVPVGIDDKPYCLLVYHEGMDNIILGDDFLRSAYIVYDYENLEISLANVNTDGGNSDIQEISPTSVPGAAPAQKTPGSFAGEFGKANPAITEIPNEIPFVTVTELPASATETGSSDGDSDSAGSHQFPMASMALFVAVAAGAWIL